MHRQARDSMASITSIARQPFRFRCCYTLASPPAEPRSFTIDMDEIQIVFALAVLYVTYRWWSRPGAPGSPSSSSGNNSGASSSQSTVANERINTLARDFIPPSHLAQVQSMFPQLNERDIKWEFVRSGRVRNVEQVVQFFLDSPPAQVSFEF